MQVFSCFLDFNYFYLFFQWFILSLLLNFVLVILRWILCVNSAISLLGLFPNLLKNKEIIFYIKSCITILCRFFVVGCFVDSNSFLGSISCTICICIFSFKFFFNSLLSFSIFPTIEISCSFSIWIF